MSDALLPGFTNTTRNVRVYSVIAWMYRHGEGRDHLRVLEDAFVQAVRSHHGESGGPSGVVGITRVPKAGREARRFPLTSGAGIVSALDAAFYGPSAGKLGLTGRSADALQRSSFATRLADAIGIPGSAVPAVDALSISSDKAAKIADQLCFCQAPREPERALLEELLFRHSDRRTSAEWAGRERWVDGPRRRTLATILDALEHGEPANPREAERMVGRLTLDWLLDRIDYYQPHEALEPEAAGIALSTLRWLFRFALEAAWSAFGRLIQTGRVPQLDLGSLARGLVEEADGESAWEPEGDPTLSEVLSGLPDEEDAEDDALDELLGLLRAEPDRALVIAAVLLARIADLVEQLPGHLSGDRAWFQGFLSFGTFEQLPLSQFAADMDPSMKLSKWLRLLLERYVVQQHFLTAARKWGRGTDGFLFRPGDEGYELTRDVWEPDGGQRKLSAAIELMHGVGLVTTVRAGAITTLEVTDLGRAALDRVVGDPGSRA